MSTDTIAAKQKRGGILFALIFKVFLPIVILAAALSVVVIMFVTKPTVPRAPRAQQTWLVETMTAKSTNEAVTIEAMGTVIPAQSTNLKARVAGPIDWISPMLVPGSYFTEGDNLVRIEEQDYELALAQRKSDLRIAQANVISAKQQLIDAKRDLKVEEGSQAIAKQEYELIGSNITDAQRDLVLRKPQLESARAAVDAAEAAIESAKASQAAAEAQLEQAQLDLERTTVQSPFNAIIEEKHIDLGDTVSTSTSLVSLVGTQQFWIELSLPENQLRWIKVPTQSDEKGSAVKVYNNTAWGVNACREGYVLRRLPSVDEQGRMARLLIAIDDPLSLEANNSLPQLLIGSYIRAEILGHTAEQVIPLSRQVVHNGNQVWIMNNQNQLEIRDVEVLYRTSDSVFVSKGVREGEQVVTTNLSMPVEGMPLRTESRLSEQDAPTDDGIASQATTDRSAS